MSGPSADCIAANPARKWCHDRHQGRFTNTRWRAEHPVMQAARGGMAGLPTRWRSGRLNAST